jgi:hypothetical protein
MATKTHREERSEGFAAVKEQVLSARLRAAAAVNREMLSLFWEIGREIVALEATESREGQTIDGLAARLRGAFSETLCFSRENLERMRAFAKAWPDFEAVGSVLVQLPWEHHLVLLSRIRSRKQRLAYAERALSLGWSSATLARHIAGGTARRGRTRSRTST